MAGRFVAAKITAAASVQGLAMALVILRGALLRLPFIGVIVAAGELIHWFGQLVQGAGSLGAALGLMGDLAREVWERIQLGAVAMGLQVMVTWSEITATIATALQVSLEAVIGFANSTLNAFQGALDGIIALWSALPGAIGDLAFQAANALIAAVEAMLNGVASRINAFLEAINAGLAALGAERQISLIGTLELGRLENAFEGAAAGAGAAARDAFEAVFSATPIATPDLGFGALAQTAQANVQMLQGMLSDVSAAARAPLESVTALSAAVAASGAQAEAGLGNARIAAAALEEALAATGAAAGRAGGAGRAAGGALTQAGDTAAQAFGAAGSAISEVADKSREIAQGLAQDILGPIKEALTSGELSWQTFADAISRIAQNLAKRLIEAGVQADRERPDQRLLGWRWGGGGGGGGSSRASSASRAAGCSRVVRNSRPSRAGCGQSPDSVSLLARDRADGRSRTRGDLAAAARTQRATGRRDEQWPGTACTGYVDAHHQRPRPVRGRRLPRHALGRAGDPERHPPQPECAECLRWAAHCHSGPSRRRRKSTRCWNGAPMY
jgi:hypothetical protein